MKKIIKDNLLTLLLILTVSIFFIPIFRDGKIPVPADTIIGLYHPYRDNFSSAYPNGIPFKNFLITDPVRQTLVWKDLSIGLLRQGSLPVWNPYEMSGKPLLANFQSGVFYPFNLILFLLPFKNFWTMFIVLQSILAAFFTYLYLTNLKVHKYAAFVGALSFTFSSFFIVWLEWGNVGHTLLWLPLILYAMDRIFEKKTLLSGFLLLFSLVSSFFAGHLQTFFYIFILSITYLIVRWIEKGRNIHTLILLSIYYFLFTIVTSIQWIPTLQYINLSTRQIDQDYKTAEGWFIPFHHLVQFVAPDFFGNPTTLNYWGTWNYAELTGYIGVLPLFFALYALLSKRDFIRIFYGSVAVAGIILSLPTFLSKLPFSLGLPFVSSAQPTRLLSIVCFALAVLSAYGMDELMKKKISRSIKQWLLLISAVVVPGGVLAGLWALVILGSNIIPDLGDNILVAKRNLIFPTLLFALSSLYVVFLAVFKQKKIVFGTFILIIFLVSFDLFRFAWKFTPFTDSSYLFPMTKTLQFLQADKDIYRVAVADRRIMPPNFFTYYKIQTVEGYDPLYLESYAQYIVSLERGSTDVSRPYGFNRIITPHNFDSPLFDALNTKYVLSFDELDQDKFEKVFQEGQTKVFRNKQAYERVYFVENVVRVNSHQEAIDNLYKNDLRKTAIVEDITLVDSFSVGTAKITSYFPDKVIIETDNSGEGFLVLSDVYYPLWSAKVDGKETRIYKVNSTFRGVKIADGKHTVEFIAKYF